MIGRAQQIGKRPDGSLNHKPISQYCEGIPRLTDEQALATVSPRDAEHEAELSAAINAIAQEIRDRREHVTPRKAPPPIEVRRFRVDTKHIGFDVM